jgi:hypothetical protein
MPVQVSFGIFDTEPEAAKQYDRALILEKGRSAKTNFPIRDYEQEVAEYEAFVFAKWVSLFPPLSWQCCAVHEEAWEPLASLSAAASPHPLRCYRLGYSLLGMG